jgi:cytosine/adenosine deaminase-related metal-dependent hydrolase
VQSHKQIIKSAWIAPMDSPPIREAAVAFANGKILAVGEAKKIVATHPDAEIHDLGDSMLLPGLVNSHTHLELSHISRIAPQANLAEWIIALMKQIAAEPQLVEKSIRIGVEQSLRFGVTSVGDISKQCTQTRPLLRKGPLRIVSYGEIQAMAQRRKLLDERFAAAADLSQESPWLRVGLTPHAPYTVEPAGYEKCLRFAREHHRPLATHLAETSHEEIFLADHSGPFRNLWEVGVNAWDDDVPKFATGPIEFAQQIGLLDYPTLLAHVNYCNDAELEILARGKASVVYCPRTHEYFGHLPHRWREMLERGINVAIGTDSCASSPDLNLMDDLRLLRRIAPDISAQDIWEMGTIRAAKAIMMEDQVGSITPGKFADFVSFDGSLQEILQNSETPTSVWIDGMKLV